jgi:acetolactate synthase-1/3 small subunit
MSQKHTISAWVRNRPGVLNRVASLFRRRLFNIESLTVGHSETPGISRMTIGIDGTNVNVEQVVKQLYKLIDVVKITDVSEEPSIMIELALIKAYCLPEKRPEIFALVDTFRGKVVDIGADSIIVETTGTEDKVDALIGLLRPYGIREIVRTGRVAMSRGGGALEDGRALRALGA